MYLLTANHCGNGSSLEDYSDWVFDFNFESPDCDKPVFEPEKNTIYGSELLAHAPDDVNSFSDFKLLLLSQNIPSDFQPYFIGDKMGLSPFWVIVSVIVGGGLFGVWGILLSVPVAAVIRISIKQYIKRRNKKVQADIKA